MAIFVMGIGLLSLLVLFPVGILNMAQAIKDERSAQAVQAAAEVAKIWDVRNDSYILDWDNKNPAVYAQAPRPPAYYLYTYPDPIYAGPPDQPGQGPPFHLPPLPEILTQIATVPSYPVFVDPIGYSLGSRKVGELYDPAGMKYSFGIPRTSLTALYEPAPPNHRKPPPLPPGSGPWPPLPPQPPYPPASALNPPPYPWYPDQMPYALSRWFTLLDDLNFDPNGQAKAFGSSTIQRESRYSWAFLCRQVRADIEPSLVVPGQPRPDYASAKGGYTSKYGVELTGVIYDRRPWAYTGAAGVNDNCAGESSYRATFTKGSNVATLVWAAGSPPPPVRRGTWILDATMFPEAASGSLLPTSAINGHFYRVLSVAQPSATLPAPSMDVELHINARSGATFAQGGVAVVMENVVEVFDRGQND